MTEFKSKFASLSARYSSKPKVPYKPDVHAPSPMFVVLGVLGEPYRLTHHQYHRLVAPSLHGVPYIAFCDECTKQRDDGCLVHHANADMDLDWTEIEKACVYLMNAPLN